MNELESLLQLNKMLLAESPQYLAQAAAFPPDAEAQWRLFRSLVNVRAPRPAGGFPPAFVFGKTVVRTQVHRHGLSAFRAPRDQRGGDAHVFLFFHHAQDKGPVIIGLPVTRLAALE